MATTDDRPVACPIGPEDVLETTSDAIFVLERDLTIKYANVWAMEFFRIAPGDCLGRPLFTVFPDLAASHTACELAVRLESTQGTGTALWMYLPRHRGDAPAADRPACDVSAPPGATASAGGRGTDVVVEDEAPIRRMIAVVLTELGYTVLEAEDGPDALRILEQGEPIALLITDVGLPGGLNGRQVADAAGADDPDLRVLFITGFSHGSEPDQGDALDRGVEIMRKPFSLEAFAAKVTELISPAAA